jgi:hypothetical protein
MQLKDTPPTSPYSNETMDYDELFEDDVEEVIDDEAVGSNNYTEVDDASDEDIGIGSEGNENSEENKPVRDDSTYVFSRHKGQYFLIIKVRLCHLDVKTVMSKM